MALLIWGANASIAQSVKRQGDVFIQQSTPKTITLKNDSKTKFTYKTKDGKQYPIYLSRNGKAFIVRTSKNGKLYKQYLPEVTQELNNNKH